MAYCERCGRPISAHAVLCTSCYAESTALQPALRCARSARPEKPVHRGNGSRSRGRPPKASGEAALMQTWDIGDHRSPTEAWDDDADDGIDRSDGGLTDDDQPEDWMDPGYREKEDIYYHDLDED